MKTKLSDVVSYMKQLAPLELAADWDNVGLLLGDHQAEVKRIMTCLTLTPDVATEAMAEKVDVIITHHPILFRPAKSITTSTSDGRMLWNLIRAGVAVYSAHTAFDNAPSGLNQQIADELGLVGVEALRASPELLNLGEGRLGNLPKKILLSDFVAHLKTLLRVPHIDVVGDEARLVGKIAIACGAGGEFLKDALKARAEVFLTGELRFHDYLTAKAAGLTLCLPGHYASERLGMEHLATKLRAELNGVDVWASKAEENPVTRL